MSDTLNHCARTYKFGSYFAIHSIYLRNRGIFTCGDYYYAMCIKTPKIRMYIINKIMKVVLKHQNDRVERQDCVMVCMFTRTNPPDFAGLSRV